MTDSKGVPGIAPSREKTTGERNDRKLFNQSLMHEPTASTDPTPSYTKHGKTLFTKKWKD
jgi:hypothetical protein